MLIDLLSVAIRAIGFLAVLQAAGAALFIGLVGDRLLHAGPPIRRLIRSSAWVAAAALLLYQGLAGARYTGELSGIIDWPMQTMALESNSGIAQIIRFIAALGLVVFAGARVGWGRAALLASALLVVLSFALMGHTASAPQRWLLAPLLVLHLTVAAYWFGSLLPLSRVSQVEPQPIAVGVINHFSSLAQWLVPALALAGLAMAWVLLPEPSALLRPYGLLLLVKIVGFAVLLAFAAANKLRFVPEMERGDAAAGPLFRKSVALEFAVACIVVVATAVMTGLFSPEA